LIKWLPDTWFPDNWLPDNRLPDNWLPDNWLNPKLVLELHAALRRTGLGGKLPYQSFVAFLHWRQDRAAAGWDPQRLDTVVAGM
jgi:hypothetical protein